MVIRSAGMWKTPHQVRTAKLWRKWLLPGQTAEKRWFAVYTTCRHEKEGCAALGAEGDRVFFTHLPDPTSVERWVPRDGGSAVVSGYVFVRIDPRKRVGVLEVPGVVSMIGTASRPAALPDFEVEALQTGLDPMRAEPHPLLTVGQRVRIRRGALAGVEGFVIRKKSGVQSCIYAEPAYAKYRH